jgi:hypothetical protein
MKFIAALFPHQQQFYAEEHNPIKRLVFSELAISSNTASQLLQ